MEFSIGSAKFLLLFVLFIALQSCVQSSEVDNNIRFKDTAVIDVHKGLDSFEITIQDNIFKTTVTTFDCHHVNEMAVEGKIVDDNSDGKYTSLNFSTNCTFIDTNSESVGICGPDGKTTVFDCDIISLLDNMNLKKGDHQMEIAFKQMGNQVATAVVNFTNNPA